MKSSSGKSFTIWSDNPKMNTAPRPVLRGYRNGGQVPDDTRPGKHNTGKPGSLLETAKVAVDRAAQTKSGVEYDAYDTTMEAEERAPQVVAGQTPKVSPMRTFDRPSDVRYYGEENRAEAERVNQERWDAYNRRVRNEAIRTGNPMPGESRASATASPIGEMVQSKAVHYGSKVLEPVKMQERIEQVRQDMQSKLEQSPYYTNKATAIAELEEQLKRRKKKEA